MTTSDFATDAPPFEKLRVVVVGGGVAALETVLALADLAPEETDVALLAPGAEFVYRPMTVREPFAYAPARRFPLQRVAADTGAELISDELSWIGQGFSSEISETPTWSPPSKIAARYLASYLDRLESEQESPGGAAAVAPEPAVKHNRESRAKHDDDRGPPRGGTQTAGART
jgi:hypothetical protein